jgi:NTP pyrophosphatase (non-canonical NTP hydrolase)
MTSEFKCPAGRPVRKEHVGSDRWAWFHSDGIHESAWELCQCQPRAAEPEAPAPSKRPILDWAVSVFGSVARNRNERAARLVEEAIELAQVEGVEHQTISKIAERVFSKPTGTLETEIGDVGLTLEALAENVCVDLQRATAARFAWLQAQPVEERRAKHDAKVAAGTAYSTEPPKPPPAQGCGGSPGKPNRKAAAEHEAERPLPEFLGGGLGRHAGWHTYSPGCDVGYFCLICPGCPDCKPASEEPVEWMREAALDRPDWQDKQARETAINAILAALRSAGLEE